MGRELSRHRLLLWLIVSLERFLAQIRACRMPQSAISRMFFRPRLSIIEPVMWARRRTAIMSLTADQKYIRCDGEGCAAITPAPVALRPRLNRGDCAPQAAEGWLFVVRRGVSSHYCPACLEQALILTDTEEKV
jgi:hypothetical protein